MKQSLVSKHNVCGWSRRHQHAFTEDRIPFPRVSFAMWLALLFGMQIMRIIYFFVATTNGHYLMCGACAEGISILAPNLKESPVWHQTWRNLQSGTKLEGISILEPNLKESPVWHQTWRNLHSGTKLEGISSLAPNLKESPVWHQTWSSWIHVSWYNNESNQQDTNTGSGRKTWRFDKTAGSGTVCVGNLSLSALLARIKAFQLTWSAGL
jgi:hypothetical protein